MEASIRNTIGARFGTNGEVNQLRSNLTKPYQDQIWNAIKTVSTKNNFGIVLDKSNNISVIFLDKKYDYTEAVLSLLGKSLPKAEETKTTSPNRGGSRPGNSTKGVGKQKSASSTSEAASIEKLERKRN